MNTKVKEPKSAAEGEQELAFEQSIGYQIRQANRLMQRYLQQKIEPYGVTPGMWYFLRALWHQDGMTQRELSLIVGTMEPTTLTAIKAMERNGLVRRVKNTEDRRKVNIFLTRRGHRLRAELMPLAIEVVRNAVVGFSDQESHVFLSQLKTVQDNLLSQIHDISKDNG